MKTTNLTKVSNWLEILRPFSWTASIIPIGLGTFMAYKNNYFSWFLFFPLLFGVILLQGAANIINEYYDFKSRVDSPDKKRSSMVLVQKRIKPLLALKVAWMIMAIFLTGGLLYTFLLGKTGIIIFTLIALCGAYFYTAPPLQLKYHGFGLISVFFFFGITLPQAIYYTYAGTILLELFWLSLPVALLIGAILYGNDLRDLQSENDFCTIAGILGLEKGLYLYILLILLPYLLVTILVYTGMISAQGLLVFITIPLALKNIWKALSGVKGDITQLIKLDQNTAVLHMFFGLLWLFVIIK